MRQVGTKRKLWLAFVVCQWHAQQVGAQPCALDLFVANDQSGSVSALENIEGRQFISALFTAMQPWGTGPGESRMAIADWDSPGVWQQFGFPAAGPTYTTLLADVLAYQTAPRTLFAGTDPYTALLSTYQQLGQSMVPGRLAKKVIVLMTDAACSQVPPGVQALAAQIKNAGVYIIVVAIEAAAGCPALAGTNVASPGGYFSAPSYAQLIAQSAALVQGMVSSSCNNSTDPSYDLAVAIDSYTASGCISPPQAYAATVSIENQGPVAFSGPLTVSFYNGPPTAPTSQLLLVHAFGPQVLAPGSAFTGTVSSLAFAGANTLYAVVNYDGAAPGNAPPIPFNLSGHTAVAGEHVTFNNTGAPAIRVSDPVTCPPQAVITTSVTSTGLGCNDLASYTITLCNTGDADAFITPTLPIAAPGAVLVSNVLQGGSYTADLDWATYCGGDDEDEAFSVATDASGNVYIAGTTRSTTAIATPGSHQPAYTNGRDAFLVKFNGNGVRQWGTYYGGTGNDYGMGVATDAAGNVYLVGYTSSITSMATAGAHQAVLGGGSDAFIAKFSPAGVRLWASYYGGSADDFGYSVACDAAGNALLAGVTSSTAGIATAGAFDNTFNGASDHFVVKFNAAGVRQWGTYHGGAGAELEAAVSTDAAGNVLLAGQTASAAGIATAGAAQAAIGGVEDGYVAKFSPAGARLWATYCGGLDVEEQVSVACDGAGNVFLSGTTGSDNGIAFLAAHQAARAGSKDGFLQKYGPAGNRLWGTYLGGGDGDEALDVATDAAGNAYVTGHTDSPDLIATPFAYATALNGVDPDAFLMKFRPDGTREWGTYYGGELTEDCYTVAVDPAGSIFIAGATESLTGIATPGAHQLSLDADLDAFLAKFIEVELPYVLAAGQCLTRQYLVSYAAVAPGTYSLSLGVIADAVDPGHLAPEVLPDQGFNAGGFINIDGFNGAAHAADDVTVPVSGTSCPPGGLISVAVDIPTASSCGNAHYVTATVTITNTSGLSVAGAQLFLDLLGAGASYASELYGLSPGLSIMQPNVLDPAYPLVPDAIFLTSGSHSIGILSIPPGASSFQVDLSMGATLTNLQVRIDGIHTGINPSGQSNLASDAAGVAVFAFPAITGFNCPGSIAAGGSIALSGIGIAGAATRFWSTSTVPALPGGGTLAAPSLNYVPTPLDVANGFVEISLTAVSANGCETTESCQVQIENVVYDYGDAPIEYDLNINYQPPAAASTLFAGVHLGLLPADVEPLANNSILADGDGTEEDGLTVNPWTDPWPPIGSSYALPARASNSSSATAFLHAFVDWNADGDFLDINESSINTVAIPPMAGTAFHAMQFTVPPTVNTGSLFYIRLRLSVDSMSTTVPYMAAPRGETEDYVWASVGPLPVQLLTFTGRAEGDGVRLDWITATESGSSHFAVERSTDALLYGGVGTVAAAGCSQAAIGYTHVDRAPVPGLNYYRLRQVDLDGSEHHHGPVAVWVGGAGRLLLRDLGDGRFQVLGMPEEAATMLTDALGRQVGLRPDASGAFDASGLAMGAYQLVVQGQGRSEVLRFVKR